MAEPARFPTLTQQLFALASGSVTSDDLVRRSLDAITASQPTLNAFRVVLADQALADAAEADRKRAAGQNISNHPLLGIPIAVKDDVDVKGVPTRFGAGGTIRPALEDAEVVRRLKAAGAVIVGKTNTCELGQWPFTSGPAFGHTRNPWSREHTPGGSSGGSAAAVAAGLVAAAIGSDGAGSVRIPAAWTHLVGIKPQRGRISTWPLPEAFNGITVNGVLARTVTDAAIVLDAASGNAPGDLHKPPPVQVSEYVGRAPGPLRIALSTKFPYTVFRAKLHPEIRAAMEADRGAARRTRAHDRVAPTPATTWRCRGASCRGRRRDCWTGRIAWAPTSRSTSAPGTTCARAGCCRSTRCARPVPGRPRRTGASGGSSTSSTSSLHRRLRSRPPTCTTSTRSAAWPPTAQ